MTQLTLFDAPNAAHSASVTPLVAASAETRGHGDPATDRRAESGSPEGSVRPAGKATDPSDGLQRMGDLARLVLLRYQLVAQRRAALAAKSARG